MTLLINTKNLFGLLTIIACSLVVSSSSIPTQKIDRHVIMFKITSSLTHEQAAAIDATMSQKDGILASRTNTSNSIYFCYTEKAKDLKEADFKQMFKEMGYDFTCFDKVVQGEGVSKTFEELENC